jgi:hypothetical protein
MCGDLGVFSVLRFIDAFLRFCAFRATAAAALNWPLQNWCSRRRWRPFWLTRCLLIQHMDVVIALPRIFGVRIPEARGFTVISHGVDLLVYYLLATYGRCQRLQRSKAANRYAVGCFGRSRTGHRRVRRRRCASCTAARLSPDFTAFIRRHHDALGQRKVLPTD